MNKPIAWINEYDELESFNPDNRQDWIPLYTHPLKEQELLAEIEALKDKLMLTKQSLEIIEGWVKK